MNKAVIGIAIIIFIMLARLGFAAGQEAGSLKNAWVELQSANQSLNQEIQTKGFLTQRRPMRLSSQYAWVIDQLKVLESYSGTQMALDLDGIKDTDDIAVHYVATGYKGVKGLKVRITINRFSQETDMGAVLDDIHLLEKNTDFMADEIAKENNNVIVKGEIYGL